MREEVEQYEGRRCYGNRFLTHTSSNIWRAFILYNWHTLAQHGRASTQFARGQQPSQLIQPLSDSCIIIAFHSHCCSNLAVGKTSSSTVSSMHCAFNASDGTAIKCLLIGRPNASDSPIDSACSSNNHGSKAGRQISACFQG